VLPQDVLRLPKPLTRYRLVSATDNVPVHEWRDGRSVTVDRRRKGLLEGSRALDEFSHTVWGKPGRIFDRRTQQRRTLLPSECAALQGFPASFDANCSPKTTMYRVIGNAIPPPVARHIVAAVMASAASASGGDADAAAGDAPDAPDAAGAGVDRCSPCGASRATAASRKRKSAS
jgi:hypothetical protein